MTNCGIGVRVLTAMTIIAVVGTHALADPQPSVTVLPIDGNADPAIRAKLSTSVGKLARVIDGKLTTNATTFADTAAAAGCDPSLPACAESVRTLLQADEMVYGTATATSGQITVVVRRKRGKAAPTEVTATFPSSDSPEQVEPTLLPLFTDSVVEPPPGCPDGGERRPDGTCGEPEPCPGDGPRAADGTCPAAVVEPKTCDDGSVPSADGACPVTVPPKPPRSRDFKLGLGAAIGGGTMLVIGLVLWNTAAGKQDSIDAAPTATVDDLVALRALEDDANRYAWSGNLLVFGGLALGGVGGYLLWRDHGHEVAVTPVVTGTGAGVRLGGVW